MTHPRQPGPPPHPPMRQPPRRQGLSTGTIVAIAIAGIVFLGGALAIGAAAVGSGSSADDDANKSVVAVNYSNPPTGTSGDLEFAVLNVATGYKKIGSETAAGEFVTVKVKVTNIGKSEASFDPDAPYIFDAADKMYSADSKASGRIDDKLNPGMSITKNVVYDVPPGTKPTTFSASGGFGVPFARITLPAQN